MEETIKQTILYLRDVLGLSFYQIQDRTGISRKRASRIYQGSCQDKKERRGFILDEYRSLIASYSRYLFATAISLVDISLGMQQAPGVLLFLPFL